MIQRTTLSFLTESKASAVGLISMRRVAMALLAMLLTTASAWADIAPTTYYLTLNPNYQGGLVGIKDVQVSNPTTYTLTKYDEPTCIRRTFLGWSDSSDGEIQYHTGDIVIFGSHGVADSIKPSFF